MRKSYVLRLDGQTILIKVGRAIEYIGVEFKDKGQIFDCVKYALISKGVFVSNERLTQDLHEILWDNK